MKTIVIDGVEFNVLMALNPFEACSRCDVREQCQNSRGERYEDYISKCIIWGANASGYLKRVSSAVEYDKCEEFTKKLDIARTALALIYGGVKVCRTIDEIRSLCAKTLEETK